MNKLVIFGIGQIAELAHHYFTHDSDHEVVGFTVDGAYVNEDRIAGLPVCPFEDVAAAFAPNEHSMFVALGYTQLNQLRTDKVAAARSKRYTLARYISSRAAVAQPERIGEHCFILEDSTVQPFVTVGDNVFVWSWAHIGHHGRVGDNCFLSPCCIAGNVTIGANSFVGVGATVRDKLILCERCVIGAGALILSDCAADGVYKGHASERASVQSSRLRAL
jgi:sugar O-acyltransferase (sialic acid O-acetyltransferase NeuD family)